MYSSERRIHINNLFPYWRKSEKYRWWKITYF